MDSAHEFVEKLHDRQEKDRKNKETDGNGSQGERLQTKQHSTNK